MGRLAQEWESKGKYIEINGRKVFVIDTGGNKPVLLILHGFPTSSMDFYKVLDPLRERYRVIIHDHIGFGHSDKPVDYSYSLKDQASTALLLWDHLGIKSAHLLAHDYGTSIATEILARRQDGSSSLNIESLFLNNGSMLIEMAKLRPIQKLLIHKVTGPLVARLTSKRIFSKNIMKIYFDESKISEAELSEMWDLILKNNGRRILHPLGRYNIERRTNYDRWIGAISQTEIPTKIIWSDNDPIAVKAMGEKLHSLMKNSTLIPLPETGHFPMLENPDAWLSHVL